MGILKLALIGGAGYLAVKKINDSKKNKNQDGCRGPNGPQQQQHQQQQQQQQPYPGSGSQYPDEKQPRGQTRDFNDRGFNNANNGSHLQQQHSEQRDGFYDFEPRYQQDGKVPLTNDRALPPSASAEGGEQRKVWNEKAEYQRN